MAGDSDEMGALDAPEPLKPGAPTPATPQGRSPLSQTQRDELIAEILGDVGILSDRIEQVTGQVQALTQALTANDFVRWRNTLDMKMSELADVNLSEQSAKRLGSFAQTYIEQLTRETNTMVTIQVKKAVADTMTFNQLFDKLNRDWLMRLSTLAAVCLLSTVLGNWIWSIW
jgi:hypothetical protein